MISNLQTMTTHTNSAVASNPTPPPTTHPTWHGRTTTTTTTLDDCIKFHIEGPYNIIGNQQALQVILCPKLPPFDSNDRQPSPAVPPSSEDATGQIAQTVYDSIARIEDVAKNTVQILI